MVLATHELDEAERLADRVVIFDRGRLVADGTLAELRSGHDEIRFRSAPTLDVAALAAATRHRRQRASAPSEYVIDAASATAVDGPAQQLAGRARASRCHDLRAGAQRLEDVFRRLTGGGQTNDARRLARSCAAEVRRVAATASSCC